MGSEYLGPGERGYAYRKWISVGKLREILKDLPDDWTLEADRMNDLSVWQLNAAGTERETFRGFVDMGAEEWEWYLKP
jgi:hypothetical protein